VSGLKTKSDIIELYFVTSSSDGQRKLAVSAIEDRKQLNSGLVRKKKTRVSVRDTGSKNIEAASSFTFLAN
jgi:hypothetical protein